MSNEIDTFTEQLSFTEVVLRKLAAGISVSRGSIKQRIRISENLRLRLYEIKDMPEYLSYLKTLDNTRDDMISQLMVVLTTGENKLRYAAAGNQVLQTEAQQWIEASKRLRHDLHDAKDLVWCQNRLQQLTQKSGDQE